MHSHRPKPAPPAPPPPPTPAELHAKRLARWGAIAINSWYLGGFALLVGLLILQVGPFGAVSGWFSRHWGYDSPMLAFLPFFAILSVPVVVLQVMPRSDNPFIRGAQNTLAPDRSRKFVPRDKAHFLKRNALIMFAIAGVSLVGGTTGFFLLDRTPPDAGQPLPERTVEQIVAHRGALPGHVRLVGMPEADRPLWIRLWNVRTAHYEDITFPLDGPGLDEQPARMIGLDSHSLRDDAKGDASDLQFSLPVDGELSVTSIPQWKRERMADSGFAITDPVIQFEVDPYLHGRMPGADTDGAILSLVMGIMFALFFGIPGVVVLRKRRALLADSVPAS